MKKIDIKSHEEIEIMRQGGQKLAQVKQALVDAVKPGITTGQLDRLADRMINELGGEPAFKLVHGYKHATCISVNEEVVHGIPGNRKLEAGDVVALDVGMVYKGWNTDTSTTIEVKAKGKEQKSKVTKFLEVGRATLKKAIAQARPGKRIADISRTIEEGLLKAGYSPVKALTGHGIGRKLHEEPAIPCFVVGRTELSPKIEVGMALAIEIMYNEGGSEVVYKNDDGWTIATADGKMSGLFEETVAITNNGPVVLTQSTN
jgi:methionyl aminopeptidase